MNNLNKEIIRILIPGLLLVFMYNNAQGQDPDIFGSFPYGEKVGFSHTVDVQCIGNYYYFITDYQYGNNSNRKTQHISVIKTDMNFNIVNRVDSIMVANYLQSVSYIIYSNDKAGYALLAGSQYKSNKTLYNIFKLDLKSLEVHRTDSIQLPSNRAIDKIYFKQINDTTLVTFGVKVDLEIGYIPNHLFIEVSTSGKIKRFIDHLATDQGTFILGFEYLEKPELYFVYAYNDDYYVYDKNLNVVQRVDESLYLEGIHRGNELVDSRFIEEQDGYIHCIGRVTLWARQYSITHLRFPILGDSIGEADQIDPLCETHVKFNPEFCVPAVDEKGNVLIVLDNQFSYPGGWAIDTTTLYILKTNYEDYKYRENEWFISFRNGTEMSVWTADADKNGDFVIAGGYWSEEFYGDRKNFYLKVQSDGTITTTKGPVPDNIMVVYPNPTYGPLLLKSDRNKIRSYEVYNTLGRLVKRAEINSRGKFEINDMSAGTYFLIFKDRKGKIIGKSRVVKY